MMKHTRTTPRASSPWQQRLDLHAKENASERSILYTYKILTLWNIPGVLIESSSFINMYSYGDRSILLLKITTPTIRKKAKMSQTSSCSSSSDVHDIILNVKHAGTTARTSKSKAATA